MAHGYLIQNSVGTPARFLARWLFLRLLGAIYLIAFVSLWTQIIGLVGHNGISPADRLINVARQRFAHPYHQLPTLAWLSASDGFLHVQCACGVALSAILIIGVAPAPVLFGLWMLYLSLSVVGADFLHYQWDVLLLETGFLAIFYAPWQLWPRPSREPPPSLVACWLLRWLLFRLMFQSGLVKLFSGDPTWRNGTALCFHYETQPLPTWIGWYAHQLPAWFHEISVAGMFAIELGAPFLIFLPGRGRLAAFFPLVFLQLLIALTGNYCFFNWLAIALCLVLLDDMWLGRILPSHLLSWLDVPEPRHAEPRYKGPCVASLAVLVGIMTGCQFLEHDLVPTPVRIGLRWLAPFRTFNSYGLFAMMTTARPEIVIEGSNEGDHWTEYEFKYKPGDLGRRPRFVAPHQPRLDWQMWFAALERYQDNPWFLRFLVRLLEGSPDVLALLANNPFPDAPPRYIRAVLYDYRFTDFASGRAEGTWWRRERIGLYCPMLSLDGVGATTVRPRATRDSL